MVLGRLSYHGYSPIFYKYFWFFILSLFHERIVQKGVVRFNLLAIKVFSYVTFMISFLRASLLSDLSLNGFYLRSSVR